MGVTTCKECGKTISDSAKTCPYCGHVYHTNVSTWKALQGWFTNMSTWKIVGIFAFIFLVVAVLSSYQEQASEPAEWEGWEQAEDTVKNLPCTKGGTVDQYLTKKADIPAMEDLGWKVYPRENGFKVERLLLLSQTMSVIYRWHVDKTGKATPINGKAMGITPGYFSPDPKIKSRREYQGSYKDWQPYKDYLKMDDKYKSPAYEKLLKDSYEAEGIVKNLPCSKGGTLDQYFSKNRHPQLKDLGWNEYSRENGVDVVREFLGQTNILEYRWHVDKTGKATPLNSKAISITKVRE